MDELNLESEFPKYGVVPKRETGALAFLEKYPKFNGDGVIVAVLDSGCDPLAEGLHETPDGRPKIINFIDATGAGDVNTSKTVKPDENGIITGLSGRKLKVSSSFKNPSGEFHIGLLYGYNVYTKRVRNRLQNTRAKVFKKKHDKLLNKLREDINNKIQNSKKNNINTKEIKQEIDDMKLFLTQV